MTASCSVLTGVPTSSLIAGNRIVTAEVLALTMRVETHAATITPRGVLGAGATVSSVLATRRS